MYNKYFCKDIKNVENYDKALADNFRCWELHHRLETHNSDGEKRSVDITQKELIALGMYYNRPATELVFLTKSEHRTLHHKNKQYRYGKHHTEEAKKKIGEAKKGTIPWCKGKHLTNEIKNKLSEAAKGMHYYNNGYKCIKAKECPEGFVPGMLRK